MIYIIFLLSIILHEIGHLTMARILNINISNVKFKIIGVSAEFGYENEIQYLKKFFVILMGPFLNLVVSLFFVIWDMDFIYKNESIYVNFLLFAFNFLPIIPLDGGNLLLYILNLRYDFEKSFKIVSLISKFSLSILSLTYSLAIFVIKNVQIFLLIIYLWYIFIKEENNFELYIKINKNMRKHLNLQKKCAKIPSVIK